MTWTPTWHGCSNRQHSAMRHQGWTKHFNKVNTQYFILHVSRNIFRIRLHNIFVFHNGFDSHSVVNSCCVMVRGLVTLRVPPRPIIVDAFVWGGGSRKRQLRLQKERQGTRRRSRQSRREKKVRHARHLSGCHGATSLFFKYVTLQGWKWNGHNKLLSNSGVRSRHYSHEF